MTTAVPRRGDPSPFRLEGGPVGLLLVHGFTGSPGEVRPTAEELHRRGLTIHAPLLPGHGTTPQDLNTRLWQEWADAVTEAYERLRGRCEVAFLGGLSMGSLLSLLVLLVVIKLFPLYLGPTLGAVREIFEFRYLNLAQSLGLLTAGALIGLLGSLTSVSRFLKA
jgi:hypothetical protein